MKKSSCKVGDVVRAIVTKYEITISGEITQVFPGEEYEYCVKLATTNNIYLSSKYFLVRYSEIL